MKVRSTKELVYSAGRDGEKRAIIEIDLKITNRNETSKVFSFLEVDSIVSTATDNDSTVSSYIPAVVNDVASKYFELSYTDYDKIKADFLSLDDSDLEGSYLEDKLLQDYLLDKVTSAGYYDTVPADWFSVTT